MLSQGVGIRGRAGASLLEVAAVAFTRVVNLVRDYPPIAIGGTVLVGPRCISVGSARVVRAASTPWSSKRRRGTSLPQNAPDAADREPLGAGHADGRGLYFDAASGKNPHDLYLPLFGVPRYPPVEHDLTSRRSSR